MKPKKEPHEIVGMILLGFFAFFLALTVIGLLGMWVFPLAGATYLLLRAYPMPPTRRREGRRRR